MNLETTTDHYDQVIATSAGGSTYDWNVSGRKTTLSEYLVRFALVLRSVLLSKPARITFAASIALTLVITSVIVMGNVRERAHQAHLQRTSRVVVL